MKKFLWTICAAILIVGCGNEKFSGTQEILNVSCEPTREFYTVYNERFKTHWENELQRGAVIINQSHGASGKQARAVAAGSIEADVVTLSISYDVTQI